MIDRLIELSARHRGIVIGMVLAMAMWGAWSIRQTPIDAFPDLSDTQLVLYSRWDRSPDLIEDQVTYPIVTAMLGAPKVKAVRGHRQNEIPKPAKAQAPGTAQPGSDRATECRPGVH